MIVAITSYVGIQKFYFRRILKCCSQLGNFMDFPGQILLDFGCGSKELKKFSAKMDYVGYDISPALTEVRKWEDLNIHTIVLNHTLMYLDELEIRQLFSKIKGKPEVQQIIVGIGRQNFLSNVGKFFLRKKNAHLGTKTQPEIQKRLLEEYFVKRESKSVFFMTDILLLELAV